jgi:hypothetical protein
VKLVTFGTELQCLARTPEHRQSGTIHEANHDLFILNRSELSEATRAKFPRLL